MRWQCQFVNSDDSRCKNEALHRLHFASEHLFDFTDCCEEHLEEYKFFCWTEDLHDKNGEIITQ